MPDSFHCNACKLCFAVGWQHFHGSEDGYGAETLLVCSACGTMHAVRHPLPKFVPVLGGLFRRAVEPDVPERLLALPEPYFVERPVNGFGFTLELEEKWQERLTSDSLPSRTKRSLVEGSFDLALNPAMARFLSVGRLCHSWEILTAATQSDQTWLRRPLQWGRCR